MKTKKLFLGLFVAFATMFFISCEDNNVEPSSRDYGILPERFKVNVPSSLSNELKSTGLKSTNEEFSGNEIYEHLTNFIAIGEGAADIVEDVIWSIAIHKIDQVKLLEYVSEDDNRTKKLIVEANVEFHGRAWEYMLTIIDLDYESNEDGGIGMQVFWNTDVIEGITLIKPSNLNINDEREMADAMFSIEYSEGDAYDYDAHMIVEVADMPLNTSDDFSVDALKMFVGKKGDIVDVYGNSNHPQATMFGSEAGMNWAFVASGKESEDIGIAEVGLPASNLDATSRKILLEDNSIRNIFLEYLLNLEENKSLYALLGIETVEDLVSAIYNPALDKNAEVLEIRNLLENSEAPGYFNNAGFVTAGEAPNNAYSALETSLLELTPYNPKSISELSIEFK